MFPATERQRRVIVAWAFLSGFVHLLWEGSWSIAAPLLQTDAARHDWRLVWTLYGRADYRYVHADPFVRSLEFVTGTVVAALNLWAAFRLVRRRGDRGATIALLIASVMEVYGTVLYFGSELLNGWANVDTSSVVHTWVMFFGLNALWLAFPGWCIYEILAHGRAAPADARAARGAQQPAPSRVRSDAPVLP